MPMFAISIRRILVCAVCAWSPALLAQNPVDTRHSMREDEPALGTRIKRTVVSGSNLPFDLRYDQLSPDQRQYFHSLYERVADGDEPPYPLNGLKDIYGPLSAAQRKLLVEGDLDITATVGSDGAVQRVSVHKAPSKAMGDFASKMLMATPFKPARCSGQPCRMDFPVSGSFMRVH